MWDTRALNNGIWDVETRASLGCGSEKPHEVPHLRIRWGDDLVVHFPILDQLQCYLKLRIFPELLAKNHALREISGKILWIGIIHTINILMTLKGDKRKTPYLW